VCPARHSGAGYCAPESLEARNAKGYFARRSLVISHYTRQGSTCNPVIRSPILANRLYSASLEC
jgi:hypothetical protein